MDVLRRYEGGCDCPTCGRHYSMPNAYCAVNHEQTNCVQREVEYVRADAYRGAVEENRQLRALIEEAPGAAAGSRHFDWTVKAKAWLTDHLGGQS